MPSEPKKPIEELLEASARARRSQFGAGSTMPNPMRAHLQAKVARLHESAAAPQPRSWLARFWPQLSLTTAVAAALALAATVWMKSGTNSRGGDLQLAMNAPAPNESTEADQLLRALPAATAAKTATASAGLTSAKPEGEVAEMRPAEARNETAAQARQTFAAAPAPAAAEENAGLTNPAQQFSQNARGQTLRNQANNKQTAGVLDNFQVEQDGGEIRLIDADGSTYTGRIATAPSKLATQDAARARLAKATATEQNGIFFRASGFNARLQKRVVFEGNYIPLSPNESKDANSTVQAEPAPPSARVIGTAQVTGETPVEVDAISITR